MSIADLIEHATPIASDELTTRRITTLMGAAESSNPYLAKLAQTKLRELGDRMDFSYLFPPQELT